MARRKKRGGKRSKKIPLAATAGVAAALIPIASQAMGGDFVGAANALAERFTGYSPASGTFNPAALQAGLMPILLGIGVSMLAAKAGINRYMRIPFIKL